MNLEEVQAKLATPEFKKFKPYLGSFSILTDDEQEVVLKKHYKFAEYYNLLQEEMRLLLCNLQEALSVGGLIASKGEVLQVEDLETTLKLVSYEN